MAEAIRQRIADEPADKVLYGYDQNAVRVPVQQPETEPARRPERVPMPKAVPQEAPRRRISLLYIAVLVIGVVLFGNIISMRAQLTQLAVDSQGLRSGISSMRKDQSALRLALNNKMTQVEIEEYAVNTLGMVKATDSDVSYLSYHNDAVYEIAGGSQPTGVTGLLWQAVKNGAEKIWNFIN